MKISGAAFLTLLDKIFGVKLCYLAKSPVPIHVHPSYAVLDLKYEFSAAYVMGPDGHDTTCQLMRVVIGRIGWEFVTNQSCSDHSFT